MTVWPVEEIQRARLVAKEVLRRIKEHPDTYYQYTWVEECGRHVMGSEVTGKLDARVTVADWEGCGTRACVAGHAAHVDAILPGGFRRDTGQIQVCEIDTVGRRALRLTQSTAGWLFDADRSYREVIAALEYFAGYSGKRLVNSHQLMDLVAEALEEI